MIIPSKEEMAEEAGIHWLKTRVAELEAVCRRMVDHHGADDTAIRVHRGDWYAMRQVLEIGVAAPQGSPPRQQGVDAGSPGGAEAPSLPGATVPTPAGTQQYSKPATASVCTPLVPDDVNSRLAAAVPIELDPDARAVAALERERADLFGPRPSEACLMVGRGRCDVPRCPKHDPETEPRTNEAKREDCDHGPTPAAVTCYWCDRPLCGSCSKALPDARPETPKPGVDSVDIDDVLDALAASVADGEIDYDDLTTPEQAREAALELLREVRIGLAIDPTSNRLRREPAMVTGGTP